MADIKPYLQLTRAHTAPLETVPAILGASLATGTVWSPVVGAWGLVGLLYHLAGYGMNSLVDWEKGYDQNDRNKAHHPLNTGSLSLHEARLTIIGLFSVLFAITLGLSYSNPAAYIVIFLGAVSGVVYNCFGKSTHYKFLFISAAHTSIFIIPYIALGGDIYNSVFIFSSLYVFLWVVFQISVSGEIKDIMEYGEMNFIRDKTGWWSYKSQRFDEEDVEVFFSIKTETYAMVLKMVGVLTGAFIYISLSGSVEIFTKEMIIWFIFYGVVVATSATLTSLLVGSGPYNRDRRIQYMAMIELVALLLFISAYTPLIGLAAVTTLIVGSFVWVLALNKIEWGTWLAPDV